MTGGKVLNERVSHTHYKTVNCCNEKKKSIIPSLPVEIIFSVLVWIPADILYNSMRYVCRQWYNIIRDPVFVKEQLIRSSVGLFVKWRTHRQFVEVGKMKATMTELGFPFSSPLTATCDGLVLLVNPPFTYGEVAFVANPLTKQMLKLPPHSCQPAQCLFSLACSHLAREYKVVFQYMAHGCQFFDWMIVTVGKDQAWRLIDSKKLSNYGRTFSPDSRLSTGGFLYHVYHPYTSVVALDVESETFYEFPSPTVLYSCDRDDISYLARGKYLSCIVQLKPRTLFDVWELSNPTSGGWRKLYTFNFDVQKYKSSGMFKGWFSRRAKFAHFRRKAWVNNGEVVVLSVIHNPGPFIAHNVKTGATFFIGNHLQDLRCFEVHGYAWSLVSLAPS
ncbi:hypothetical protein Vadar_000359 [Vaccinium darrowii]|uniref:Uncharacterized protein n=1 Tax=Vaccinium darrowii TaxID=229202 RepID=A0ACB7Z915_9ERIC|nr:hypothetical protein Vadar_000359 [Vaccinium darrowii]